MTRDLARAAALVAAVAAVLLLLGGCSSTPIGALLYCPADRMCQLTTAPMPPLRGAGS